MKLGYRGGSRSQTTRWPTILLTRTRSYAVIRSDVLDDADEVRMRHNQGFASNANKKHRGYAENDAINNQLVAKIELSWYVSTALPT